MPEYRNVVTSEPPKSQTPRPNRKRTDPLVGTVLDGRFQIEEVLGSGGMSVVYKATQLRVNRHVAIKTLRMQLDAKPIYRERFQNEINLLCALSHPNIVTVYDCVIGPDDQPYVVMDYLRGRSLELLIDQDGPMSVDRFSRIAVQVCGALDHAHRKGVIHRDLKPGNIVLMDDEMDFVKVVDFGLAKLNDANRRLTQSGELWGSPPYMSPEHCQSKAEDERSDLYSFGAVMYEMLTGKDPFHFATTVYELIQIHINTPPPPLAETNPLVNIPKEIEAVIFKTMAKNPDDRYQTASELRDAIIEASGGAHGRHSGDLLSFPTLSKGRSQSTGETIPAPESGAPKSSTPSEFFRRALDPMEGINVDELFDDTTGNGKVSKPQPPSEPSTLAPKTPTTTKPVRSNIRDLELEARKPLVTLNRIAMVVAFCVIAFVVNALPNIFHLSLSPPAPVVIPQQPLPTQQALPTQPAPVAAQPSQAPKPKETIGSDKAGKDRTVSSTLKKHIHTVSSVRHIPSTTTPPIHSSTVHPSNAAKPNPWDTLQGMRANNNK